MSETFSEKNEGTVGTNISSIMRSDESAHIPNKGSLTISLFLVSNDCFFTTFRSRISTLKFNPTVYYMCEILASRSFKCRHVLKLVSKHKCYTVIITFILLLLHIEGRLFDIRFINLYKLIQCSLTMGLTRLQQGYR